MVTVFFPTWCWKNTGIVWGHPLWPDLGTSWLPICSILSWNQSLGDCWRMSEPGSSKDLNNPSQSKNKLRNWSNKTSVTDVLPIMDQKKCPYGHEIIWVSIHDTTAMINTSVIKPRGRRGRRACTVALQSFVSCSHFPGGQVTPPGNPKASRWLVAGWALPLWKMMDWRSVGMIYSSQYDGKVIKFHGSKPPTSWNVSMMQETFGFIEKLTRVIFWTTLLKIGHPKIRWSSCPPLKTISMWTNVDLGVGLIFRHTFQIMSTPD